MKRASFILILCMLLCLASCGGETNDPADTSETAAVSETETAAVSESETETGAESEAVLMAESETEHVHEYSGASCLEAPTCSCGETDGYALGHSYSDGSCIRCGAADPDYNPVTEEQRYALERLSVRIAEMPYSYDMITDVLMNEGIAYDDCIYAADHCGKDWNAQALEMGKIMGPGHSYSGMYELLRTQLKFTDEQARYAVDNCGFDWMEQAVKGAENMDVYYKMSGGMSRDSMIKALEKEGFTHEQAVHAADVLKR